MRCTKSKGFSTILLLTLCAMPSLAFAQGQADGPARKILELTDAEQIQFIRTALEQGLPEGSADQMTMLVINRSSITLPLIEGKIEQVLKEPSPPQMFIDTAAELIASLVTNKRSTQLSSS